MKYLKFLILFFVVAVKTERLEGSSGNVDVSVATGNKTKVVGGSSALRGELPYQVALYHREHGFYCGGSLIIVQGKQLVLSAAHCVEEDYNPASYIVNMGELRVNYVPGIGQTRSVSRILMHEQYSPKESTNDIALLSIDKPFKINQFVHNIRIARPLSEHSIREAVVSGWGRLKEGGPQAAVLQKATIPIINNSMCRKVYPNFDASTMICAGSKTGGCEGDSGGPLASVGPRYFLAGIFSFGHLTCTTKDFPGVYTKVSAYYYWMQQRGVEIYG